MSCWEDWFSHWLSVSEGSSEGSSQELLGSSGSSEDGSWLLSWEEEPSDEEELSEEELAEWAAAFEPVQDVYLETTGQAGQELMDLLDEEMAKLG